jgi:hypothetical protein
VTCRRCSECADSLHHWHVNGDFGNAYVCKHCDAVGDECSACEGTGELMDEEGCNSTACPACNGEGIVESRPRSYEDLP